MPNLANNYTCTGCLACVDTCAKGALTSCYNEEGHLSYKINPTLCVECGICEKRCPVVNRYKYGENVIKESTPFAAWSKDDELRARSTSGGVFASLAKYVILRGGIAIGACMQHNAVRHIAIDRIDDIYKLQGSKYTQSNTAGIYRNVKQFLQEGREVLFSGLGCQVAGLLSYLSDKPYPGNLYTVDLICGGVPSSYIIERFLNQNPNIKEIVGFRNKEVYEFSVIDNEGVKRIVPLSERPFPLCGFYTELTNRYSCYDCHFNGAHRKSDITIGDYWGDTKFPEEHKKGLSIAVAHTSKGWALLENAHIEIHEVGWETFLSNNPRMIDGQKRTSKSKARKMLATAFRDYSYEKLLQEYANKATWHEPGLMLKKICWYVKARISGVVYRIKLEKRIKKLYNQ